MSKDRKADEIALDGGMTSINDLDTPSSRSTTVFKILELVRIDGPENRGEPLGSVINMM